MRRRDSLVPKPSHCLVFNEWTWISVKCETFRIWSLSVLSIVSECSLQVNNTRTLHFVAVSRSFYWSVPNILTKVRDQYCSRSCWPMILIENIVFTTHTITRSYDSTLIQVCIAVCERKWLCLWVVFSWRASVVTSILFSLRFSRI